MNRQAIILGIVRWLAREMAGRTAQYSPMRVCMSAAESLALAAPAAAEAMLGGVLANPLVAGLLAASQSNFDAVVEAFRTAVRQNEKMVVTVPTPLGPVPYSLTETDIQNLAATIRQAAKETAGVA